MNAIELSGKSSADAAQAGALPAPRLFQARDGNLDLQTLHPGDPVVVTVLALGAKKGDELAVLFGGRKTPYTIQSPGMMVYDILIGQEELPPAGEEYSVQWSWGERNSPEVTIFLAAASLPPARPSAYHGSVQGLFMPGLLDAWLVTSPYQLRQDAPVVQTLEGPRPAQAVSLPLGRQSGPGPATTIGTVSFDPDKQGWAIEMNADVDLLRNDLLSISVPEGAAQYCNFAFAI
jgi:hypothetical protein